MAFIKSVWLLQRLRFSNSHRDSRDVTIEQAYWSDF